MLPTATRLLSLRISTCRRCNGTLRWPVDIVYSLFPGSQPTDQLQDPGRLCGCMFKSGSSYESYLHLQKNFRHLSGLPIPALQLLSKAGWAHRPAWRVVKVHPNHDGFVRATGMNIRGYIYTWPVGSFSQAKYLIWVKWRLKASFLWGIPRRNLPLGTIVACTFGCDLAQKLD